jgi:hypothetical protein
MRLSTDLQALVGESGAKVSAVPWWLRPFLMRGVIAITLGRRIYVAADHASEKLEELLRHELTHVRQIAQLGLVRFYWRYLREYIALRRRGMSSSEAYRNISFEVEAYAAERAGAAPL